MTSWHTSDVTFGIGPISSSGVGAAHVMRTSFLHHGAGQSPWVLTRSNVAVLDRPAMF